MDGNEDGRLDEPVARYRDSFPLRRAPRRRVRGRGQERRADAPRRRRWSPSPTTTAGTRRHSSATSPPSSPSTRTGTRSADGRSTNRDAGPSSPPARTSGFVTSRNAWNRVSAPTIFLRRRLVEAVGFEDETLGPGADTPWGAADETDYVLRAVEQGFRIRYEPGLHIYHSHPAPGFGGQWTAKAYAYGRGSGYVLRRHRAPWWFALRRCAVLGAEALRNLVLLRPSRAAYYAAMGAGRVHGWLLDRSGEPRYPAPPGTKATIADSQTLT